MKKILKWTAVVLGGVIVLVIVLLAGIYVYMEHRLDSVHEVALVEITVPEDTAIVAEGARLARHRGCNDGCHGRAAKGQLFFGLPDGTRVVAPDLGRIAIEYSTAELARVIRHGVRPDGTSVVAIMPSRMLHGLSDRDLGAIIAWLRRQPPSDELLPERRLGPMVRAMLFYFEQSYGWNVIAAEELDHDAPRLDPNSDDQEIRGQYLAMTSCPECHGEDLRGVPQDAIPSLAMAAAYSLDDFRTLMRTGDPIGGREFDLMKDVAVGRFAYFTDDEIADLHAYLGTLAEAPN